MMQRRQHYINSMVTSSFHKVIAADCRGALHDCGLISSFYQATAACVAGGTGTMGQSSTYYNNNNTRCYTRFY
jgi:hypothetical protein